MKMILKIRYWEKYSELYCKSIQFICADISHLTIWLYAGQPLASEYRISGHIGIISKYILRGNTAVPENDHATIQGGLDYQHAYGFYLGY